MSTSCLAPATFRDSARAITISLYFSACSQSVALCQRLQSSSGVGCKLTHASLWMQLQTFLGILSDTGNLTLATTNVTGTTATLTGASPGVADPSAHVVPAPNSQYVTSEATTGCSESSSGITESLVSQGLSPAVLTTGYDNSIFSYVGCRCNAGYDNIYTLNSTGRSLLLHCGFVPSIACCSGMTPRMCMRGCVACCLHVTVFVLSLLLVPTTKEWCTILAPILN